MPAYVYRIWGIDTTRTACALRVSIRVGREFTVIGHSGVRLFFEFEMVDSRITDIVRSVTCAHGVITVRVTTEQNTTLVQLGCSSKEVRPYRVAKTKGPVCAPSKINEFVVGLAT